MMQRLTCDACKGRGGQHISMVQGQRLPCRDLQNCMAAQRWRVVIVDGEGACCRGLGSGDKLRMAAVDLTSRAAGRTRKLEGEA